MPYCGTDWVSEGTLKCPNGEAPTKRPPGSAPEDGTPASSGDSTLTATYGWNQDTTPVILGKSESKFGYEGGRVPAPTNNMTTVADAQNYFNEVWGAGAAANASAKDKANLKGMIAGLRRYTNSELGTRGAVESAWNDALKDASRAGVDVFSLLGQKSPTSSDDKSRGYSGPVSSTTFMDERDVDRTANALALELIGRPLSDKELAKVTKRLRSEESANPTVTTPGVGSSMTESGLSAEGRSDVLREVISENPDFQQFQVDHTVLDSMLASLTKREKMVNG